MLISLTKRAQTDYRWMEANEPRLYKKIDRIIDELIEHPFMGTGKPEPLKHEFSGWWSRRISQEHRLIYKVDENTILIYQCRYHYGDH